MDSQSIRLIIPRDQIEDDGEEELVICRFVFLACPGGSNVIGARVLPRDCWR